MKGEPSNAMRAAWAVEALQTFADATWCGQDVDQMHPDDLRDCISDLMCDLMHLAKSRRLNVDDIVARAASNFEDERSGR